LLLLPYLTDRFGGAKNFDVKEEVRAAIGALPTLALKGRYNGEGGKGAAAE